MRVLINECKMMNEISRNQLKYLVENELQSSYGNYGAGKFIKVIGSTTRHFKIYIQDTEGEDNYLAKYKILNYGKVKEL